jgi:chromosome segregation ATPase
MERESDQSESLFQVRGGFVPKLDDEEMADRLRRSQTDRKRIERQLDLAESNWARERDRYRGEVAELTSAVERLRDQAEENSNLKQELESASLRNREMEVRVETRDSDDEARIVALRKRIDELEQQIVELLSRSSNDHRRQQAAEARIEVELDVHKRKLDIEYEQKLRVAQIHLKKENRVLEKEIERLRHEVVRRPPSLFERLRTRES